VPASNGDTVVMSDRLKAAVALVLMLATGAPAAVPVPAEASFERVAMPYEWPLWERFHEGFIQDDGRVIDWTSDGRTVSEGQAYALFFALIANDRDRFARILRWTHRNLAGGNLSTQLPAWLWGRDADNDRWGILDPNPASDADLFIAYALFEAARLWQVPDYETTAKALLDQVRERETMRAFDRAVLLPAPAGFVTEDTIRLNPSYIPPFQLHYLAQRDPDGPWANILVEHAQALSTIAPNGLPPDWVRLGPKGYVPDQETGTRGSYDAIRVFLWAALRVPGLDAMTAMREALAPSVPIIRSHGRMPERWDIATGQVSGNGPPGFQFVAAAWLDSLGSTELAEQLASVAQDTQLGGLYGRPARYYDQVLALFAQGYRQDRYRFDEAGRLLPAWEKK